MSYYRDFSPTIPYFISQCESSLNPCRPASSLPCDRKGEWVEDFFLQRLHRRAIHFGQLWFLAGSFLIQQVPAHRSESKAASDLDNGQRDTKEIQHHCSASLYSNQENGCADGNPAGQRPVNCDRCCSNQA